MGLLSWLGFGPGPTIKVDAEPLLLSGPELGAVQSPPPEEAKLAPYPLIDRYPVVLGSNLSLASISQAFRSAQTGWRQPYVDLLDELLEREPHGFAVLSQRVLSVSGGRLEFTAPDLPEGSADAKRAEEIRDFVEACYSALPDLEQALTNLQWGIYYGVSASEISWARDGKYFRPTRLHFIHSRRLSWPDPNSWSLHIWDQGAVRPSGDYGTYPTQRMWGIKPEDFPGKFIVHMPQIRGDYPTRDGLGREVAYWFALKGMAARGGSQFVERFGKPWAFFSYSTGDDGKPRIASNEDIAIGDAAAKALGIGALAGGVIPDSLKLNLAGPGVNSAGKKLAQRDWAEFCDLQVSKAVLWVTDTTEPGSNGSRASTEVRAEKSKLAIRYDADCLAASLHRDLTAWIVKLNFPGEEHLTPKTSLHVEEKPDPMQVIELASKAAAAGMPVDAEDIAERIGLKLVDREPPKDPKKAPRRLAPLKPVDITQIDNSITPLLPPVPLNKPESKPGETDKQNAGAEKKDAVADKTPPKDTSGNSKTNAESKSTVRWDPVPPHCLD